MIGLTDGLSPVEPTVFAEMPSSHKQLVRVGGLYIWVLPAILVLLEFLEVTPTPKNVSKPFKCLVIKSLVLSTPLRVLVLG